MLRAVVIGLVVSIGVTAPMATAQAAYCARYVGGEERMNSGAHAQCGFPSLSACRASVTERGGGHCYKGSQMR
jgi:hypothetical protein